MHIIIISGFLGSGKTTTLLSLGKTIADHGKKVAIIVNEVGDVGIDGDTLSGSGLIAKELTSGCICCTLKISMELTLQTLEEEYKPDVVIIEPTGIALPLQIKEHVALMEINDLSFAPIITLIDASRLQKELEQIPRFIKTQITEAEILCINKIDIVPDTIIKEISENLSKLNSQAVIVAFSAINPDEQFHMFVELLAHESHSRLKHDKLNSIELSCVSDYSGEYIIEDVTLETNIIKNMLLCILQQIKEEIELINPSFLGHIKIAVNLNNTFFKASLTSAKQQPFVEILPFIKEDKNYLKFLSAITFIEKEQLIDIVNSAITKNLMQMKIDYHFVQSHKIIQLDNEQK